MTSAVASANISIHAAEIKDEDRPHVQNDNQASNSIADKDSIRIEEDVSDSFHWNKIRIMYFFYRMSTGCIVPFMSLYMEHVGLNPNQIGTLQAIRPIVTLICGPIWGSFSDRCGKKKSVLLFLYVSSVLFRLCIRFIGDNVKGFAFALCASSMFYSAVPSILDSTIVSSMPDRDKPNFGRLRLWGELGNGVSSSIMMRLISSEKYGFQYIFIVHAVAASISLITMLSFVPGDSSKPTSQSKTPLTPKNSEKSFHRTDGLRVVLGDIQILTLFSLVIVTGYSMGFIENFCYINIRQIYKKYGQFDLVGRDVSICRMFFSIGGIMAWFFAGSWSKRFGPDIVMVVAVCCLPFSFILYSGISPELDYWTKGGFFVAESIRSGVYAALWSTATVRLSKISPPQLKSTMQSMMESVYRGFGHTSGAFLGGILCKRYELLSDAFLVAGKGLLSFLIVIGTMFYITPRREISSWHKRD